MQETVCNLCGADNSELLWMARDLAFGLPGEFPLVRCRDCGLIYLRTRPGSDEIGYYYPPEYAPYRPAIQDERLFLVRWARRHNIRKRQQVVEKASPRVPGRILDVGCSTGIFLDAMREAGWETQGVEISVEAVRYTRQRFGLTVFAGQLLEAHLPPGYFDVVTFWDVLEHTFDPLATLCEAHRLLTPEGIVVMTLPNWESLDRRLFGRAWIGYDTPRHLYVFSRPVLCQLLERAGFQSIQMWCGLGSYFSFTASAHVWLSQSVHISWLRRVLEMAMDFPGARVPVQPFFSLGDRLGYSGISVVLARKVKVD